MTLHTRRALRATAVMAGVAALGATFSGTALAADQGSGSAFSSADQESGGYLGSDGDTGGYFGDKDGGYIDNSDLSNGKDSYFGKDGSKDGVGHGSLSGVGGDMVPFKFPARGPSTTVPVRNKNDDGTSPIGPPSTNAQHDHRSAGEGYDYDFYNPTESYRSNKCSDHDSARAPFYASDIAGANGDSSDDCKVDSGDYHPRRTGYQGAGFHGPGSANRPYQGYSGYLGTDQSAQDTHKYANGGHETALHYAKDAHRD